MGLREEEIWKELQGLLTAIETSVRDEEAEIKAVKERHRVYRLALREKVKPFDAEMTASPPENVYLKFLLASTQNTIAKSLGEKLLPKSACAHLASITRWTGEGLKFVRVCEYCYEPVSEKK